MSGLTNLNNPLSLDLSSLDVLVINGNVINTAASESIYSDASSSDYIYMIMNVNLDQDQKNQLSNLGIVLNEYIAKNTYLCRFPSSDLGALRQLPFVRTANVYAPWLKVTSSITDAIARNPAQLDYKVIVRLHDDASQTAEQVAQNISNQINLPLAQMEYAGSDIQLTIPKAMINVISQIDAVNRIEERLEQKLGNEYARGILGQNWDYSSVGYGNDTYKWRARNEVVCVADSGVDVTHRAFEGRIYKQMNLWEPYKSEEKSTDPDGHGTHVAGSVVEGVAQECKIIVQGMSRRGPDGGIGNYVTVDPKDQFRYAFDAGAYIHTNSWGPHYGPSQVDYETIGTGVDKLLNEGYQDRVVLFAACNSGGKGGWQNEIGAQNSAKNVITVGNGITMRPNDGFNYSANHPGPDARMVAKSSSVGWAPRSIGNQGRYKPDCIAPGTAILSCKSGQMPQENLQKYGYHWREDYVFATGTSMATPAAAGCCAVIREALRAPIENGGGGFTNSTPAGALIKALLINGCVDLVGHRGAYGAPGWDDPKNQAPVKVNQSGGWGNGIMFPAPSTWQGFGRIDLTNSLLHIERYTGFDKTVSAVGAPNGFLNAALGLNVPYPYTLGLGGELKYSFTSTTKVVSVTLCWYDPAGPILQNQLNLTVLNGNDFHCGNRWARNDRVDDEWNNVQKVKWVRQPHDSNQFTIVVKAARVNGQNQSFALAWLSHE